MNQHRRSGLGDLVAQLTQMPAYTVVGDTVMPPCRRAPTFVKVDDDWELGPHGLACPDCTEVMAGRAPLDADYAELAERIDLERDMVHRQFAQLRMSLRSFGAERIVTLLDGAEDRFKRIDY